MSTQQAFATARDLEEIGIARDAIQAIPLAQRKRSLKAASGVLAPYLRKRAAMPLTPSFDPDDWNAFGMVGGAAVTYVELSPGPTHARDVRVSFPVGGIVGQLGPTYAIDLDSGAYGSAATLAGALPLSGDITIDGLTFTLAAGATVAPGDAFTYSTRVDAGACSATCHVAAYTLLGAQGVDPITTKSLKDNADAAIAWAKDVAKGDAELELDADATPARAEAGPRFTGQRSPWEWMDRRRRQRGGCS